MQLLHMYICIMYLLYHILYGLSEIKYIYNITSGFEIGMWDLFVLVPDHCLSFYFTYFTYCISILNA